VFTVQIPPEAPTQRPIPPSVSYEYTSESWEVNGHTTRYTSPIKPHIRGLAASDGVLQRANETEISAIMHT